MNFEDPHVRECYQRYLLEMAATDAAPEVSALIATHDFFQRMEGPHSMKVHQTMDLLLSLELRPRLREWHRRSNANLNAAELAFRSQLNALAGEQLEREESLPGNPS